MNYYKYKQVPLWIVIIAFVARLVVWRSCILTSKLISLTLWVSAWLLFIQPFLKTIHAQSIQRMMNYIVIVATIICGMGFVVYTIGKFEKRSILEKAYVPVVGISYEKGGSKASFIVDYSGCKGYVGTSKETIKKLKTKYDEHQQDVAKSICLKVTIRAFMKYFVYIEDYEIIEAPYCLLQKNDSFTSVS